MGMGFLSSIDRVAENEDADPVGDARDPIERFTAAAAAVGLIRPGDELDRNLIDLCLCVVEMAARIGDGYAVARVPARYCRHAHSGRTLRMRSGFDRAGASRRASHLTPRPAVLSSDPPRSATSRQ